MKASQLIGRGDYTAAGTMYEEIVAVNASDSYATMMLALCYEQQNRVPEAMRLADESARQIPSSLVVLKAATRLAIATGDHEKATAYVRQALALPEVQTEMPQEGLVPRRLLWAMRLLTKLPGLRRRIRPDAFQQLEPGARAVELAEWKRWAHEYLACRAGATPPKPSNLVN